jgi:hypothetical protein
MDTFQVWYANGVSMFIEANLEELLHPQEKFIQVRIPNAQTLVWFNVDNILYFKRHRE